MTCSLSPHSLRLQGPSKLWELKIWAFMSSEDHFEVHISTSLPNLILTAVFKSDILCPILQMRKTWSHLSIIQDYGREELGFNSCLRTLNITMSVIPRRASRGCCLPFPWFLITRKVQGTWQSAIQAGQSNCLSCSVLRAPYPSEMRLIGYPWGHPITRVLWAFPKARNLLQKSVPDPFAKQRK